MKIIALEEHFITPREEHDLPPGAQRGNDREKLLGFDVVAALLDLGETRLAAMDAAGIDVQVLSHNQPGCQALDAATAVPAAREVNDLLSEAIKAHPDRFAGLAALPTADPAAAVKELDRAVTRLGFKGAMINGHTRGAFLDDRRFWGIFECAQALGVPIYLHPSKPHPAVMQAYFDRYPELALAAWGFGIDTGAHFLRLVFAGVFDAFPRLTFILGHLGEGLPYYLWRIDNRNNWMKAPHKYAARKRVADYMRANVHLTTSGHYSTPALLDAIAEFGVDRVMFSVDYPFEDFSDAAQWFDNAPLSETDRRRIGRSNALKLFKLPGA
jgi:predicted TIM-barrel fold metal-dependent hydrolase